MSPGPAPEPGPRLRTGPASGLGRVVAYPQAPVVAAAATTAPPTTPRPYSPVQAADLEATIFAIDFDRSA